MSAAPSVEILEAAPGRFEVHGALTFQTARRAREAGLARFGAAAASVPEIEVSLGGVRQSDSAGLAVLLDWLAFASRSGRGMRLSELPAPIRAVARISEVDALLERGVEAGPAAPSSGLRPKA